MTTTNSITGDKIQSKKNSAAYCDGWDLIFKGNAVNKKTKVKNKRKPTPKITLPKPKKIIPKRIK